MGPAVFNDTAFPWFAVLRLLYSRPSPCLVEPTPSTMASAAVAAAAAAAAARFPATPLTPNHPDRPRKATCSRVALHTDLVALIDACIDDNDILWCTTMAGLVVQNKLLGHELQACRHKADRLLSGVLDSPRAAPAPVWAKTMRVASRPATGPTHPPFVLPSASGVPPVSATLPSVCKLVASRAAQTPSGALVALVAVLPNPMQGTHFRVGLLPNQQTPTADVTLFHLAPARDSRCRVVRHPSDASTTWPASSSLAVYAYCGPKVSRKQAESLLFCTLPSRSS